MRFSLWLDLQDGTPFYTSELVCQLSKSKVNYLTYLVVQEPLLLYFIIIIFFNCSKNFVSKDCPIHVEIGLNKNVDLRSML